MDVPSDCESSDPSDAQLEERRESNPRGSMAPSEARAPMDSLSEMHPAVFDVLATIEEISSAISVKSTNS